MATLDVYLNRRLCGRLVERSDGRIQFAYDKGWLSESGGYPVSHSLPLGDKTYNRKQCEPFFEGLLPEEDQRTQVAKDLGVSRGNTIAILGKIGGECAGAVTLMPAGEPLPQLAGNYRLMNQSELANALRALPQHPLLAGEKGVRLSLAGAQPKLPVMVNGSRIYLPLYDSPSTHLIKPNPARFPDLVSNEALCMKLARAIGIRTAAVEIATAEEIQYLLVERYDRIRVAPEDKLESVQRLHQEDICQALGIPSDRKYQAEGGPTLKQCFSLLRTVSTVPALEIENLLDLVILNVLIGNNDAHAKNFSLLYSPGERKHATTSLAPGYDLIATSIYPGLSAEMAMRLGGETHGSRIRPIHFDRFASEVSLNRGLVRKRVIELGSKVMEHLSLLVEQVGSQTAEEVSAFIGGRCKDLVRWFGYTGNA